MQCLAVPPARQNVVKHRGVLQRAVAGLSEPVGARVACVPEKQHVSVVQARAADHRPGNAFQRREDARGQGRHAAAGKLREAGYQGLHNVVLGTEPRADFSVHDEGEGLRVGGHVSGEPAVRGAGGGNEVIDTCALGHGGQLCRPQVGDDLEASLNVTLLVVDLELAVGVLFSKLAHSGVCAVCSNQEVEGDPAIPGTRGRGVQA